MRWSPSPICPWCGYDISASPSAVCSECGCNCSAGTIAAVVESRGRRVHAFWRWAAVVSVVGFALIPAFGGFEFNTLVAAQLVCVMLALAGAVISKTRLMEVGELPRPKRVFLMAASVPTVGPAVGLVMHAGCGTAVIWISAILLYAAYIILRNPRSRPPWDGAKRRQ